MDPVNHMNLKSGEIFQALIRGKDVKTKKGLIREATFLALSLGGRRFRNQGM